MGNVLPDVFVKILNMSITAAYVALAVCMLRFALKKAPKAVSYALWLVVLFRLVCPVSFSSAFSLLRLGNVAPVARTGSSVTYIQSPAAYHAPAVTAAASAPAGATSNIAPANAAAASDPAQTLLLIASAVWAAGVVAMLVMSAVSHIRLKRRISDATLLYGNIYETDAIRSPFVLGVIKPRIYLPAGMDRSDMDYVLRHERMHIERRDNVVKPLAYAALCLHWFNPLVWIAFRLMCCDMEMSCDERVLRGVGESEKAGYGEALLRLSISRRLLAGSPLAFGEGAVKSRIKNVLKFKKPAFWIAAAAIVAAIAVGVCLIANPSGAVSAADKLYGDYKFDKQVYMCPFSSFLALDGYEQYYTLGKDTLTITEATGDQRIFPVTYERSEVNDQDFNASFLFADDVETLGGKPDISQYKQRYQYTLLNPLESGYGYRLYVMDDEVWLAELNYNEKLNGPGNEFVWSIYKIAKYGGKLPQPPPSAPPQIIAAVPFPSTSPAATGSGTLPSDVEISMWIGGDSDRDITIKDEARLQLVKDVVADYMMNSAAWEGVERSTLDSFIELSGQFTAGGAERESYYLFEKDGKYCMQNGNKGRYVVIDDETYQTLLEIALGYGSSNAMTVMSGDNSVYTLENQLWTQADSLHGEFPPLKPEQVAKYLQYLSIDPGSGESTPFTPYFNGEKVYGTYKLYDKDFNEIAVVEPSGLEPQTYIFNNAEQPETYIVELQATTQMGNIKFGNQYFFGVTLPEKK